MRRISARPLYPSAELRRVLDADFETVVGGLPEPCRPVVRLLLATAARKGEIAGLRWGEVRGEAIYLRRTKSGQPRWVPLSPQARLLPDRPAEATDGDLVFRGRDGGAVGTTLTGLGMRPESQLDFGGSESMISGTRHLVLPGGRRDAVGTSSARRLVEP